MKQKRLKKGFYHYLPLKRLVMMLFAINFAASVFAQGLQVSGTVTDNTGQTMPGVNVVVEGTTIGTTTDADGKYTIKVQPNASLVFSFIGYNSEKFTITDQNKIDVSMTPEIKKMEDVVVIGYGVQRKEAVTGSVASVNAETIREVPSSDITQAIQGRVAGVDLQQNNSQPGATMQIRIRGVRSLNATNDPLIVLDGIPFQGSLSDINPSDIKSLDILKDASATAIYGSRGANGVILITTYNGKKGQEAQITYNGYYGVQDIFSRYPMMNGTQFAALRHAANIIKNTIDENDSTNTDWQKQLYRTGTVQNHDISISSSTDKGHYSFSAGYYNNSGVVPLQDFTRYSLRFTGDQEIGKYLRFGVNSTSNFSITNGSGSASKNPVGLVLPQSPLVKEYNADGTLKQYYQQATSGNQEIVTKTMLNGLGDKYIDEDRKMGTYNSLFGEVKIPGVEGLKYRVNLGLNFIQDNYGDYQGYGVFSGTPTNPSIATIQNQHTINTAIENLLSYDRTFAEVHKIDAVFLYSAEQNTFWQSYESAKDIPADAFQFYNMGEGRFK